MDPQDFHRIRFLTKVVRRPQKRIFTFGDTSFRYYIISSLEERSIVHHGRLLCSQPTIIAPDHFMSSFEGFSESAVQFAEREFQNVLRKLRVLGYTFRNIDPVRELYALSSESLIENICGNFTDRDIDVSVIEAPADIWNAALLKVSLDIIRDSFPDNVRDLEERHLFCSEEERIRNEIEVLFDEASANRAYIRELGRRLQEYKLFEEYEDRFFELVRK